MRDTNEKMIELLEASNKDNIYSAVIRHKIADEELKFRFGIEQADYGRLKRILEFRPFENTGVAPYRYFFALSYRQDPDNKELILTLVRVEQLDRHKQFEICFIKKVSFKHTLVPFFDRQKSIQQMIEQ